MKVKDLFVKIPDESEVEATEYQQGERFIKKAVLNEEHALKLLCDKGLLHTFVCSPCELGELCAGWLLSEGYAAEEVEVDIDGHIAKVNGEVIPPCEPQKVTASALEVTVKEMLELFNEASDKYSRSHGIHECVIKGDGWYILRTDIGRHNAIDKAVGAAVMRGYDLEGAVMFSSGRINVQTVKKAVRCKISCLMSKAVITRQALELSRELGLKVLFSVKGNSYFTN